MKFGNIVRVETLRRLTKITAEEGRSRIEAFAIHSWWQPSELNVYRICSSPKEGVSETLNPPIRAEHQNQKYAYSLYRFYLVDHQSHILRHGDLTLLI